MRKREQLNTELSPEMYTVEINKIERRLKWRPRGVSYGQALLHEFMRELLNNPSVLVNYRPQWLINPETGAPLEIDLFYADWGLAIEFQGEQHFRPVAGMSNRNDFAAQLQRDEIKKDLCSQHGIQLMRIDASDLQFALLRGKLKLVVRRVKYRKARRYNRRAVLRFLNRLGVEYRQALRKSPTPSASAYKRGSLVRQRKMAAFTPLETAPVKSPGHADTLPW